MRLELVSSNPLATCHGYAARADDGWLGVVETPLFASDSSEPDYLVVRAEPDSPDRALVPAALVRAIDVEDRIVFVRGQLEELARLPKALPLAPEPRQMTDAPSTKAMRRKERQ